jgi:hypothetical protein
VGYADVHRHVAERDLAWPLRRPAFRETQESPEPAAGLLLARGGVMRTIFSVLLLGVCLHASPALADKDGEDLLRHLNGAQLHVVRSLMVGGSPVGATPELRALAIAASGGRNGAEAHQLRVLSVGGSPIGGASEEVRLAHLIRSGGRTGGERHRIGVLERGGSPLGGASSRERTAARLRSGRGR